MFNFKRLDTEDIIKKINNNNKIKRMIMFVVALFLLATLYNLLLLPSKLVIGGVGGIAVITSYLYNWDSALVILIISVVMVILSLLFLEKDAAKGAIAGTFLYPIFVELTSPLAKIITVNSSDLIIVAIFVGLLTGICHGIIYKTGYSQGGLPIISQILHKYSKISMGTSSFIINSIIIILGGIFFGYTMMLYALITIYINSVIIDKVLLGTSTNKAFYIVTGEEKKVKEFIIKELKHSVTVFNVKGGFLNKKREVLLTVIPTREYYIVTEGIKLIDPEAFFVVSDAYQVEGGK